METWSWDYRFEGAPQDMDAHMAAFELTLATDAAVQFGSVKVMLLAEAALIAAPFVTVNVRGDQGQPDNDQRNLSIQVACKTTI